MPKFTPKPIEIEAHQITNDADRFWIIYTWVGEGNIAEWDDDPFSIDLRLANGGSVHAREGDWIVRHPVTGGLHVFSNDAFASLFEPVARECGC